MATGSKDWNHVASHGRVHVIGEQARLLALTTVAVAIVMSFALFVTKVIRWKLARARAHRRATYIGAIGEMIARGVRSDDVRTWGEDPVFVEVVVEYIQTVAGDEREQLEQIISAGDLRARLASQMLSASPNTRLKAAAALSVMANRSVEWVLLLGLRDALPEIRIQAASGLSSIRAMSAVPRLIELLEHDDPWVSARVADQLVQYGPEAVPLLLDAVRRGTSEGALAPTTVQLVSRVLGLIGDLRACSVLRPLLLHAVSEIRIAAASALGSAGTPEAVGPLVRALKDRDWRVRARASASLATFSDPKSVAPLTSALNDESWWVRQNAAESLTEIPGGDVALVRAIAEGSDGAREAAITQFGLSGTIRAAREKVELGVATPLQSRLVDLVDRMGQFIEQAS